MYINTLKAGFWSISRYFETFNYAALEHDIWKSTVLVPGLVHLSTSQVYDLFRSFLTIWNASPAFWHEHHICYKTVLMNKVNFC